MDRTMTEQFYQDRVKCWAAAFGGDPAGIADYLGGIARIETELCIHGVIADDGHAYVRARLAAHFASILLATEATGGK